MLVSIQLPAPYKEAALPIELMEGKMATARGIEPLSFRNCFGGSFRSHTDAPIYKKKKSTSKHLPRDYC